MLEINGSYGEGGGQMLRSALVLSLATGTAFHMHSIRAGRDKPGLKPQHLYILHALKQLSGSTVNGAREGSSDVSFMPQPVKGGKLSIDVGTAGSITLLLQSVLPAARLGSEPTDLEVTGGTDVRWSPTFDYFREILYRGPIEIVRRGFYPRGGGQVRIRIEPEPFRPIHCTTRPKLTRIRIRSVASRELQKAKVAERQVQGARRLLSSFRTRFEEIVEYVDSFSTSTAVACIAEYDDVRLGADALGERGKRAEDVGRDAAEKLLEEMRSDAPVDRHAADHLVLSLALGGGEILVSQLTDHARTNLWVCEQFLGPVFRVDQHRISCGSPATRRDGAGRAP